MKDMTKLEFLTVLLSLRTLLKKSELEEALELIEELIAEAKKK